MGVIMRVPTLRQVESGLKRYAVRALTGVLAISGIFFRDRLVGLLERASSGDLATTVVWLAIALVVMLGIASFYILKCRMLEKAVLKTDPNFYDHQEYDDAFHEAAKDA
jgi:hypothetical protein